MLIAFTRCAHSPIERTVVTASVPVVLVEPIRPVRPDVAMYYKIEEGQTYFALTINDYMLVRDYILGLEGSLDFAIDEIKQSNSRQLTPAIPK